MHSILFSTSQGSPIAMLGLSSPVAPTRHCTFVVAAHDTETFNSPEGQVILPDRPMEYSCRYLSSENGTTIEFENQNGWRFVVVLDAEDEGEWTAAKGAERLRGSAMSLARATALAECALEADPDPPRGYFGRCIDGLRALMRPARSP